VGQTEAASGRGTMKDMATGTQVAVDLAGLANVVKSAPTGDRPAAGPDSKPR
jgi:histidyl-tRNA synthetase